MCDSSRRKKVLYKVFTCETTSSSSAPCTFTVNVTDNGEPGTTDTFTISVDSGPTEGGVLRSGNILITQ